MAAGAERLVADLSDSERVVLVLVVKSRLLAFLDYQHVVEAPERHALARLHPLERSRIAILARRLSDRPRRRAGRRLGGHQDAGLGTVHAGYPGFVNRDKPTRLVLLGGGPEIPDIPLLVLGEIVKGLLHNLPRVDRMIEDRNGFHAVDHPNHVSYGAEHLVRHRAVAHQCRAVANPLCAGLERKPLVRSNPRIDEVLRIEVSARERQRLRRLRRRPGSTRRYKQRHSQDEHEDNRCRDGVGGQLVALWGHSG